MAAPITVTLVEDGQVYTLRDLCALHKAKFPTIRARWRRMGCPELVPLAMVTDGPRQAARRGGYIIGKHGRPKLVVNSKAKDEDPYCRVLSFDGRNFKEEFKGANLYINVISLPP